MSTRQHRDLISSTGVYFFTTTVVKWLPLFIRQSTITVLLDTMAFFQRERGVKTIGYCIMPNHLHWIFKLDNDATDVIKVVRTFKSYTARTCIEILKSGQFDQSRQPEIYQEDRQVHQMKARSILRYLAEAAQHRADQQYQLWQRHADLKPVCSEPFLVEKLNYIHNNPTKKKCRLVDRAEAFPFSSAAYYSTGQNSNGLDILSMF